MYVSACGNVTCESTTQGLQKKAQILWHWSSVVAPGVGALKSRKCPQQLSHTASPSQ